MRIILNLLYVVAAWKWSKWRNWREYYPTFLFMLAVDYATTVLMYNHTLWYFCPTFLLPNHTITDFWISLTVYPATILLFLSRYPKGNLSKQVGWIIFWVVVLTTHEAITYSSGKTTYDHGWSLGWSAAFNVAMLSILRVHYINPGLAWAMSGVVAAFILSYFGFSLQELK